MLAWSIPEGVGPCTYKRGTHALEGFCYGRMSVGLHGARSPMQACTTAAKWRSKVRPAWVRLQSPASARQVAATRTPPKNAWPCRGCRPMSPHPCCSLCSAACKAQRQRRIAGDVGGGGRMLEQHIDMLAHQLFSALFELLAQALLHRDAFGPPRSSWRARCTVALETISSPTCGLW